MPKAELFDKHNAIQKAMNVFWEKGYKGTSLADLTNKLDIGKGSFYNTFKSKRALFEQCINTYKDISLNSLNEILNAEKDVNMGLRKFLKINLEYAVNDPQHKGCLLTNSCTELAGSDDAFAQILNDHYNAMKIIIINYLKNESELKNIAIKQVSDTIITFFIGMTVEVKLQNNEKQIEQSIHRLIQSLL